MDIPKSERQCACGSTLIEIGSEVSEQHDYVPPKIQVLQHVRKKHACPGCEQCLKTAALPHAAGAMCDSQQTAALVIPYGFDSYLGRAS